MKRERCVKVGIVEVVEVMGLLQRTSCRIMFLEYDMVVFY